LGNRIHKKLREYLGSIKAFSIDQEVSKPRFLKKETSIYSADLPQARVEV